MPYAKDAPLADSTWQAVRDFMKSQGFETSTRRVYSIGFNHDGVDYVETVGEESRSLDETVIVILEPTN